METEKVKQAAFTDYTLATTATVNYKISDEKFFEDATQFRDMDANVTFEAISSSGVVLDSSTASFRVVRNGSSGTASAKITGLSEEEIRRVSVTRARWQYGR